MPQFPFSLRPIVTSPGYRLTSSSREFFDPLSPYRQRRSPLGLLSEELWREPDANQEIVSRQQEPGWMTRPDLFSRPAVRNLVYDRDYDGPPPPPALLRRDRVGPAAAGEVKEPSRHPRGGEDHILPDAVVNSFRESLDREGLEFLKHGPRTPAERLSFAQRIHPGAHISPRVAPAAARNGIYETGGFDPIRHFVGPDGRLYMRDETATEPLAYRLRRGMEDVVGGFNRPTARQVIEAEFPGAESGARSETLEQLRGGQKWSGTSPGLDSAALPLPPRIPEIKAIEDKFRRVERDVRALGLTVGADALKHFMDGDGKPIEYDHAQFRSFPVVRKAEKGVQDHFVNWMLGTHADSDLDHIKGDLLNMKEGAILHRGGHWDAEFPYSYLNLGLQATVSKPTPDANLFGATGLAMLGGDGGFTFHRQGNRIEFKGVVEHDFDERFEFELDGRWPFLAPAKGSIYPLENHPGRRRGDAAAWLGKALPGLGEVESTCVRHVDHR